MTLNDLEKWKKEMAIIITDIHISVNNAKRLIRNAYKNEESVKKHGFFQHHWYQLYFISIIQLSKLFDNRANQKRSFTKLCNKLINEPYDNDLLLLLKSNKSKGDSAFKSKSEVKYSARQILKFLESGKEDFKKITDLRDKVYAHTDPDSTVATVGIRELEIFAKTAGKWYNVLIERFYGTQFLFYATYSWDIDYPLKGLSELIERRVNDLEQLDLSS